MVSSRWRFAEGNTRIEVKLKRKTRDATLEFRKASLNGIPRPNRMGWTHGTTRVRAGVGGVPERADDHALRYSRPRSEYAKSHRPFGRSSGTAGGGPRLAHENRGPHLQQPAQGRRGAAKPFAG